MTHEQIDRMVRKANPVRDPNTLGSVGAPVLTTPLERRMEMQVDDRPTEVEANRNRGRGPLIGVAVAAVIVVAGLVWMTRDNTPVAEPAPNATPLDTVAIDQPLAPGAWFADTDAGEASSIRGTFVIEGSGWTSLEAQGARKPLSDTHSSYVGLIVVEVDQVYTSVCDSGRTSVAAASTAGDLANQFAGSGFAVREALAPVTAFGHNGHHTVVAVPQGCAGPEFQAWTGGIFDGRYYQDNGQVVERWFLDVEGAPVMVEATWYSESPEKEVAELQAVLDTLVITP